MKPNWRGLKCADQTKQNRTEQSGTKRNRTEQSGTKRNKTPRNGSQLYREELNELGLADTIQNEQVRSIIEIVFQLIKKCLVLGTYEPNLKEEKVLDASE